jgi:hypothetical protein
MILKHFLMLEITPPILLTKIDSNGEIRAYGMRRNQLKTVSRKFPLKGALDPIYWKSIWTRPGAYW